MNNEILFLAIIALVSLGFCIVNITCYLATVSHSKKAQGTVISIRTISPSTEKVRNSKWAAVTYQINGKIYTSENKIQIPMSAEIGSLVQIRYDTNRPEKLYSCSVKRIFISAAVVFGSLLIIGLKLL